MSASNLSPGESLKFLATKHSRSLWVFGTIVVAYSILGFFLAPWLLERFATRAVQENLSAEMRIENVSINPFVLSLRINGLEMDDPEALPFVRVAEIFINFQLSSLFRRAWTFDEFHITSPELFLERDATGALNVARFDSPSPESREAPQETQSTPRLRIFEFALADASVHWTDRASPELVETRFGPVDVRIDDLNTLPQQPGSQSVVINTESSGTLRWTGSLQFNPLHSSGHASVERSHFPLISAYFKHQTGFDIVDGDADIELDYQVASAADGSISAEIENIDLTFQNILVRTFSSAGTDDSDRDILSLPKLQLSDGAVRWPEQSVNIGAIEFAEPIISLHRDAQGQVNIARPVDGAADIDDPANDDAPTVGASDNGEWSFELQQFAVNGLRLDLEDHSVQPFASVGVAAFDLDVRNITNQDGARFPTTLSFEIQSGGDVSLRGELSALPEPLFDFDLLIDDLTLAGAHPYMVRLADLSLDSGALALSGKLVRSPDEPLALDADVTLSDLLITETDEGSRLGSWDAVHIDSLAFSTAGQSLAISEVRMDKPYGDIVIAEDGSVNLGRVGKDNPEDAEAGTETGDANADDTNASTALSVTVGRVIIADAAADFMDLSLPLPFAANIAELNGDISTIANTSNEPSTVSLEGKVDEFGLFRMTGNVTPLSPALNTNVQLVFQNVDMPKFSAYSIPFAGREIATGRLDLDLGYQMTDGALVGENKIVLRDFELGEKVPHPGAMSLPLGLAVALLKDSEGKIDIDLPVSGQVDDPEFSYGGVVLKALGNLIIKIVASPFALLGNLVGVEASELEYLDFQAGRADLTPPELEKASKLAEALALRPELFLELPGVVDRAADGLALQTSSLEQIVETRMQAMTSGKGDDATFNEQQRTVLEQLYGEQDEGGDSQIELARIRQEFTVESEDDASEVTVDEIAYIAELRRTLIGQQPIAQEDFNALAGARAVNAQAAVLSVDAALQDRIRIGETSDVEGAPDEPVRMKVMLTVGEE